MPYLEPPVLKSRENTSWIALIKGIKINTWYLLMRLLSPFFRLFLLFTLLSFGSFLNAAPVGFNVAGLYKLNSSLPFTDLFKLSQGWYTSCDYNWQAKQAIDPGCTSSNSFNTKEQGWLDVDAQGWVRSLPQRNERPIFTSVVSSINLPQHFPLGRYVVLYEGEGKVQVEGGVAIRNAKAGRIEFDLTTLKRGLKIYIKTTNPRNYVKNIHLVAAANERSFRNKLFNPNYVNKVRPFSAIRFMPWQNSKETALVNWSQRPTINQSHYNGNKGVPIEVMVDLVNQTNAAPWFSIPYKANQDFVRNFARLVKQQLRGGKKVYVEYSNEVWNSLYPVHHMASRLAMSRWSNKHQDKGGLRKQYLLANWYGEKSVDTCNIWKQEFGGQSGRIICVISSFARNPEVGRETLACPLSKHAPCGKKVEAYAVAPYFGDNVARIENRAQVKQWANSGAAGLDKLFTELSQGGVLKGGPAGGSIQLSYDEGMKGSGEIAKEFGVQLVAYEAGQHLKRDDPPHTIRDPAVKDLFLRANLDPRMGNLYGQYLNQWRRAGGGLVLHFYGIAESEPNTAFGMLENVNASGSPKYNALLNFLR